jgi:hypothetical protein
MPNLVRHLFVQTALEHQQANPIRERRGQKVKEKPEKLFNLKKKLRSEARRRTWYYPISSFLPALSEEHLFPAPEMDVMAGSRYA